eukprot:5784479-Amphidinium_carterae.1
MQNQCPKGKGKGGKGKGKDATGKAQCHKGSGPARAATLLSLRRCPPIDLIFIRMTAVVRVISERSDP